MYSLPVVQVKSLCEISDIDTRELHIIFYSIMHGEDMIHIVQTITKETGKITCRVGEKKRERKSGNFLRVIVIFPCLILQKG